MDRMMAELIGPMAVAERRREAERERVLAAVERGAAPGRARAGGVGRLRVRVGGRLETVGAARAAIRSFGVAADPCHGCAQ